MGFSSLTPTASCACSLREKVDLLLQVLKTPGVDKQVAELVNTLLFEAILDTFKEYVDSDTYREPTAEEKAELARLSSE